ncbi:substrate-binding domain-containing protein [Jeotgalibacillus soli]|uniref:substrate-binding domain-containing protein n=1 Tax=Jeotgalibacillus soli TaxID=889306 RepID=UPI000A05E9A3
MFTGSDEVAADVIKEAQAHSWSVPNDFAVIGFDNQPIAELLDPQITTINQSTTSIGFQAMDIMLSLIEKKSKRAERYYIAIGVNRKTIYLN